MILLFVNNDDYPKVESVAGQLATDDHKVGIRNPDFLRDTKELRKAHKVYCYGDYPKVKEYCSEFDVPYESLSGPKADNKFDALPDDTEFPYHYGGGNYFLSDGTKVSGKDDAIKAQEALNDSTDG